jgi:hypothetical protein
MEMAWQITLTKAFSAKHKFISSRRRTQPVYLTSATTEYNLSAVQCRPGNRKHAEITIAWNGRVALPTRKPWECTFIGLLWRIVGRSILGQLAVGGRLRNPSIGSFSAEKGVKYWKLPTTTCTALLPKHWEVVWLCWQPS